ncbi:MAG TPA: LLM class F420-dependent oxidoreductase [Pseudonocardiaceae bacterium]|nr:LLM class F420-dependent oxidoreductase [Pseudonocardiaceae bacterium]
MKIGLHIPDFTWDGGDSAIGPTLAKVARTADEAGFDRISVMDHFFQIAHHGPPEHAMLEAYTALGFLAAHTERATLLTLVSGVIYRYPGILAKQVTTLDVLSGGRAWLGIGAGWNEEESRALGLDFPPLAERFEQLEEAIQICLQMWSDDESAYDGKQFHLDRTLNSPQSLQRPHPPIMIGGSGEKKTLRFVARYARSCNLFGGPDVAHKLDVLREHCEREGRDYDDVEKTATMLFDLGDRGERVDETLAALKAMADLGIQVAHGKVVNAGAIEPLKLMGREIIPAVAEF